MLSRSYFIDCPKFGLYKRLASPEKSTRTLKFFVHLSRAFEKKYKKHENNNGSELARGDQPAIPETVVIVLSLF